MTVPTQNGSLKKDDNDYPVMGGTSSVDNASIINAAFDPVTRRLLVDSTGSGSNFADNETPSGTIDGVNVTFTLAHTPSPAASLHLYLNGALQQAGGGDFTLATATITFNTAPQTNSILLASYRY